MKKLLILLFIFTSQFVLCMDVEQSRHGPRPAAGIKRKASAHNAEADKNKKQKVELQKFKPCKQTYLYDGSICGQELFSSASAYSRHISEQHILRNLKCIGCQTKFLKFSKLINHLHKCQAQEAKSLLQTIEKAELPQRCPGCNTIFMLKSKMIKHYKNNCKRDACSAKQDSIKFKEKPKKKFSPCKCVYLEDDSICGERFFANKRTEQRHKYHEQHIVRKNKCPGCQSNFATFKQLMEHLPQCDTQVSKNLIKKIEEAKIPQRCPNCGSIYSYLASLRVHKQKCKQAPKAASASRHAPGLTAAVAASLQDTTVACSLISEDQVDIDCSLGANTDRSPIQEKYPGGDSEVLTVSDMQLEDFLNSQPFFAQSNYGDQPRNDDQFKF